MAFAICHERPPEKATNSTSEQTCAGLSHHYWKAGVCVQFLFWERLLLHYPTVCRVLCCTTASTTISESSYPTLQMQPCAIFVNQNWCPIRIQGQHTSDTSRLVSQQWLTTHGLATTVTSEIQACQCIFCKVTALHTCSIWKHRPAMEFTQRVQIFLQHTLDTHCWSFAPSSAAMCGVDILSVKVQSS